MRHEAVPGQYDKHTKAKTPEQAKAISGKTPSSPAQYLPDVNNKSLEHEALMKGIPVKHSDSTTYFIYDAGKVIGYDRGMPATYIRAELANNKIYHGHPMAQDRVNYYLSKANQ